MVPSGTSWVALGLLCARITRAVLVVGSGVGRGHGRHALYIGVAASDWNRPSRVKHPGSWCAVLVAVLARTSWRCGCASGLERVVRASAGCA